MRNCHQWAQTATTAQLKHRRLIHKSLFSLQVLEHSCSQTWVQRKKEKNTPWEHDVQNWLYVPDTSGWGRRFIWSTLGPSEVVQRYFPGIKSYMLSKRRVKEERAVCALSSQTECRLRAGWKTLEKPLDGKGTGLWRCRGSLSTVAGILVGHRVG